MKVKELIKELSSIEDKDLEVFIKLDFKEVDICVEIESIKVEETYDSLCDDEEEDCNESIVHTACYIALRQSQSLSYR